MELRQWRLDHWLHESRKRWALACADRKRADASSAWQPPCDRELFLADSLRDPSV